MADVRSRLAALRARRLERKTAASNTRVVCSDPALAAAAAAVGQPQQSWDADFRERLAKQPDSDDEEDDQIVVLPPPPVKLDPIAARIAWRKRQIAAANKKTQRIIAEQFPVARLPKPTLTPEEDVNDEEDLLLEEEVDDDEDEGEETGGDEDQEDEGEGEQNEEIADGEKELENTAVENAAEGQAEKLSTKDQVDGNISAHTGSAHIPDSVAKLAKGNEPKPDSSPITAIDERPATEDSHVRSASKPSPQAVSNSIECVEKPEAGKNVSGRQRNSTDKLKAVPKEVISPPDDSAETVDSSRVTVQLATGSCSTAKSFAKSITGVEKGQTITANSSRTGPFTKLFAKARVPHTSGATVSSHAKHIRQRNSAFIDDEAEDEQDNAGGTDLPADDSCSEEAGMERCGVVANSTLPDGDAERLAQFHRQWEEKQNGTGVAPQIRKDVDNALDLSELLQRRKAEKEKEQTGSDQDDAASEFCMGAGVSLDQGPHAADEYVDAMFRDDNSRGDFGDAMDLETPEKNATDVELSKLKARALWRARQRNRSGTGADENSISIFELFGEADIDRSNHHRQRIESACRVKSSALPPQPTAKSGEKRKSANDVQRGVPRLPEWERRRIILERVEKRRRTGALMDKWSYGSASLERASRDAVQASKKSDKTKRSGAPVGGGAYAPKPTTVRAVQTGSKGEVGRKRRPNPKSSEQNDKKPSAFKALFDVLDQRPTTDVS